MKILTAEQLAGLSESELERCLTKVWSLEDPYEGKQILYEDAGISDLKVKKKKKEWRLEWSTQSGDAAIELNPTDKIKQIHGDHDLLHTVYLLTEEELSAHKEEEAKQKAEVERMFAQWDAEDAEEEAKKKAKRKAAREAKKAKGNS